jgi:hypothetical protein
MCKGTFDYRATLCAVPCIYIHEKWFRDNTLEFCHKGPVLSDTWQIFFLTSPSITSISLPHRPPTSEMELISQACNVEWGITGGITAQQIAGTTSISVAGLHQKLCSSTPL